MKCCFVGDSGAATSNNWTALGLTELSVAVFHLNNVDAKKGSGDSFLRNVGRAMVRHNCGVLMGDANMGRWMVEPLLESVGVHVFDASGHHWRRTELPPSRVSRILDDWHWDSNGIWVAGVQAIQEAKRCSSRARSVMQVSWPIPAGVNQLTMGFPAKSYRGHPNESALVGSPSTLMDGQMKELMSLVIRKRDCVAVPDGKATGKDTYKIPPALAEDCRVVSKTAFPDVKMELPKEGDKGPWKRWMFLQEVMADPLLMDEDGVLINAGTHCNLFVKLRSGSALAEPAAGKREDRSKAGKTSAKDRQRKIEHFKKTGVWPWQWEHDGEKHYFTGGTADSAGVAQPLKACRYTGLAWRLARDQGLKSDARAAWEAMGPAKLTPLESVGVLLRRSPR